MNTTLNPSSTYAGEIPQPDPSLATIAEGRGYAYSHSTPIHGRGEIRWIHTFRHPSGHTCSIWEHGRLWQTACGQATGRSWSGKGPAELTKHLARKARRYGIKP